MKYLTLLFAVLATSASAATLGLWDQSPLTVPENNGEAVPGSSPLKYCGPTDDDILVIDYVDITPNPPVPGQPLVIKASGTLKQDIEAGAYVNVEVKYGFIKLIHKTLDLCENAGEIDMECPVKKGEIILTKEVELPKNIPPGKYHAVADVFTADDEPITCILADVFFRPQKPGSF